MTKRIIAFLLTAVLSISCFPIWAFAADTVASESTEEATISVESASCIVGKEIEIDVYALNKLLNKLKINSVKDVIILTLDKNGKLFYQAKNSASKGAIIHL